MSDSLETMPVDPTPALAHSPSSSLSSQPPSTPGDTDQALVGSSQQEDKDENPANEEESASQFRKLRPRKKAKRGTSVTVKPEIAPRRVNSRAKLDQLLTLHLDVLFEIFGHLHPLDVLHLSRTTKDLRRLLMHKSTSGTWLSALASVPELPKCPEDMALPAWVNLSFDKHCHNCGTSGVRYVNFMLRVRYCRKCFKNCLLSKTSIEEDNNKDATLLRCVPFSHWISNFNEMFCTNKDLEAFIKDIQELKKTGVDCKLLVKERQAKIKERKAHADACEKWFKTQNQNREMEIFDLKLKRYNAIVEKLEGEGYGTTLSFIEGMESGLYPMGVRLLRYLPIVNKAQLLTDRIWNNIQSELYEYLLEVLQYEKKLINLKIQDQRRDETYSLWVAWLKDWLKESKGAPTDLYPTPLDIFEWDDVRALIESSKLTINENDFRQTFAGLPDFIEEWREEKYDTLIELAAPNLSLPIPSTFAQKGTYLGLAVCVFICMGGLAHYSMKGRTYVPGRKTLDDIDFQFQQMWFPEYIHHHCNSITQPWHMHPIDENDESEDENSLWVTKAFEDCRRMAWTSENLEFDHKASKAVKNIISACGMTWQTTQASELDKLDARFVCLKCSFGARCDGEKSFLLRTWRSAVQHASAVHWGDSSVKWEKVSEKDAVRAREREKKEATRRRIIEVPERIWRCMHCRETSNDPGTLSQETLQSHFQQDHSETISDPEENVDYYLAPDHPPRQPLAARLIPKKVEDTA